MGDGAEQTFWDTNEEHKSENLPGLYEEIVKGNSLLLFASVLKALYVEPLITQLSRVPYRWSTVNKRSRTRRFDNRQFGTAAHFSVHLRPENYRPMQSRM